jgi:hypothetical protein
MESMRAMVVFLALAAVAGCGGDSYETVGDFAVGIGEALCERADRCNTLQGMSVDDCVDAFVADVCGDPDIDCQAPLAAEGVSSSEADQCVEDTRDLACTAQDLPASCSTLG